MWAVRVTFIWTSQSNTIKCGRRASICALSNYKPQALASVPLNSIMCQSNETHHHEIHHHTKSSKWSVISLANLTNVQPIRSSHTLLPLNPIGRSAGKTSLQTYALVGHRISTYPQSIFGSHSRPPFKTWVRLPFFSIAHAPSSTSAI